MLTRQSGRRAITYIADKAGEVTDPICQNHCLDIPWKYFICFHEKNQYSQRLSHDQTRFEMTLLLLG